MKLGSIKAIRQITESETIIREAESEHNPNFAYALIEKCPWVAAKLVGLILKLTVCDVLTQSEQGEKFDTYTEE